jgi:photosystem II stability/assembly factor-like uncharacterized protein
MIRPMAVVLLTVCAMPLGAQEIVLVPGFTHEFRGLSSSGEEMWASGRAGTFAHSVDAGHSWKAGTIPGAEGMVLVDVEALGRDTACVLATDFDGGMGRAYRTTDGGQSWTQTFERTQSGVFLDGMAFWDRKRGVAFGDPVDGAFMILRTEDGCVSWTEVPQGGVPVPAAGEAGFAASGTAIAVAGTAHAWIGMGGDSVVRVLRSDDGGRSWTAVPTPMAPGSFSGIFGIAFRDTLNGIAVGGNNDAPTSDAPNVVITSDGGHTWTLAGPTAPAGVRYGAAVLPAAPHAYAAAGPTGIGITQDGGTTWTQVDTLFAYAIQAAGDRAWIAGPRGWIASFDLRPLLTEKRSPGQ